MNRAKFFVELRAALGQRFSIDQVKGIEAILDAWERWRPGSDRRWIAYSLATAWHETAQTMQPIEEYGKGRGRSYGAPVPPYGQRYYGRGYVQLTWNDNYAKATKKLKTLGVLKADEDLMRTPALALRPDVAAAVMIFGMVEGWFTGKSLDDYFRGASSDWTNARRIINGTDKAAKIASYGWAFDRALRTAE
jgi:putative chitinase